jgi:hypothetical protein
MGLLRAARQGAIALGLAAGLAGSIAGYALGQAGVYLLSSLTGTELVDVTTVSASGAPSPYRNGVTANTLRNTTGYQLSAATSGTVVTTVATNNLILTGAVGTLTVDLPPSPPDGQLFALNNGTGSNFSGTITVAATDSSTIANGSTAVNLGSAGSQEWQYVKSTTTWYRLR